MFLQNLIIWFINFLSLMNFTRICWSAQYIIILHLRILNLIYSYHLSHENKLTTWHTCSISLRATCSWRRTLTAVLKEVSHQTATTDPATPGVHIDQCNVFIIYHMHSLVCKKYYKYVITTNEAAIYRRYM